MDTRAIMVNFLVTVILAIIIFVPACLFVSNLFRVSEQAQDSFSQFRNDIGSLSDPTLAVGTSRTSVLILDSGTAVVYFEPDYPEVQVQVDGQEADEQSRYADYLLTLQRPASCTTGRSCLCLFRDPQFETSTYLPSTGGFVGIRLVTVTDAAPLCQEVSTPLNLKSCGGGRALQVNSYTCTQGFMLERGVLKDSGQDSYYESPRRIAVKLEKEPNSILLST